jgi:cell division protease FtsH
MNKNERLEQASAYLKQEFFGIDDVIDRVLSSIRFWYLYPEMIDRPVILAAERLLASVR